MDKQKNYLFDPFYDKILPNNLYSHVKCNSKLVDLINSKIYNLAIKEGGNTMKLGNNIQNLRKSKNLSQEELAEQVGVSRQSISKWECDESYPEWNKIPILCKIFHCNLENLVSDEELGKIMDLEMLKEKTIKIEGVNTLDIIEKMKTEGVDTCIIDIFPKNKYDHFINILEDYYISKPDGMERIKHELNNWDLKARKVIVINLMKRLEKTGIIMTMSDLIELVELI